MPFNINTFRSELVGGGARTSLFEVHLTNPVDGRADTKFPFMCKTASLPSSTLQQIEVKYFGRAMKLAGNRDFAPWAVTIINDEDFKIRNALETWSNGINLFEQNVRGLPTSSPAEYKTNAEVRQFSQKGNIIRTYKFVGLWPAEVEAITVGWDNEQVQEFQVTFAYDYFYISDTATGNAGGF
jgi:hypothetical protein